MSFTGMISLVTFVMARCPASGPYVKISPPLVSMA
jgi:hypothetical protein